MIGVGLFTGSADADEAESVGAEPWVATIVVKRAAGASKDKINKK